MPNLIFVLLDGARWDRIHISHEFMELTKSGTLLNNVTTVMPYTFGAINVIFTGIYGRENGVDGYYKVFRLKDSVEFLPEILQKNGYFTSKSTIHDKVISSRGFNLNKTYNEYSEDPAEVHSKLLKDTFKEANGKPVFSFLQFSRIHTVTVSEVLKKYEWDDKTFYDNKKENLKKYDDVFKEAGKYAKKIKQVIENLDSTNNTIIVFFTDHGTGIGERFGERNYGSFLYEETIRTFYLFIGKDIIKNRISSALLSTINILPTILELCKIHLKFPNMGKSFASYLTNENDVIINEEFTFAETGALHGPYQSPETSNVFCIKTSEHKLVYLKNPNNWNLFNLKNDPNEVNNLFGKGLSIEKNLKEKLLEWINR